MNTLSPITPRKISTISPQLGPGSGASLAVLARAESTSPRIRVPTSPPSPARRRRSSAMGRTIRTAISHDYSKLGVEDVATAAPSASRPFNATKD